MESDERRAGAGSADDAPGGGVRRTLTRATADEPGGFDALAELLTISRALASERDTRTLLNLILAKSRQVTGADAGSVYVVEEVEAAGQVPHGEMRGKRLRFMLAQNDSLSIDFAESLLPVDRQSIVGRAVIEGQPINIPDLYRLSSPGQNPWGFHHNRTFDDRTGYRARSMLTVPLTSAREQVIGVIQLINKKRRPDVTLQRADQFDDEVVPFDARSEELALALAAQAGICLENAILYEEIRNLFEGFVDASVTAIESRDPTTSGHSRRVATLSVGLAERVDAVSVGPLADVKFARDDLRQIEYAGVLHDFGKVGVREHVLVKAKKLYDGQKDAIRLRLDYARKSLEAELLQAQLSAIESGDRARLGPVLAEGERRLAELDELWQLVLVANEPSVTGDQARARLAELAERKYVDARGELRSYLDALELEALQIPRGSLTPAERLEIQSHVTHTISFLRTIPWGRNFRRIPRIAGAHHESLDGQGYPFGLKGEEIPIESRMLTIADIFDALTASDRPYKPAVPVPKALAIIEDEVKRGRCDAELFRVFIETQVYKSVL